MSSTQIEPDWSRPNPLLDAERNNDLDMMRLGYWISFVCGTLIAGGIVPGWNLTGTFYRGDQLLDSMIYDAPSINASVEIRFEYTGDFLTRYNLLWKQSPDPTQYPFRPYGQSRVYDGNARLISSVWTYAA